MLFLPFLDYSHHLWILCNFSIPFLEMRWAVPDTESLQIRTSHKVMQYILQYHILWSKSNILFLVDGFLHNFSFPLPLHTPSAYDKDLGSCINLCSVNKCFLFNLVTQHQLEPQSLATLERLPRAFKPNRKKEWKEKGMKSLIHPKPLAGNSWFLSEWGSKSVESIQYSSLDWRDYKFWVLN